MDRTLPRWGHDDMIPVGFAVVDRPPKRVPCTRAFPGVSAAAFGKVTWCHEMRGDSFARAAKTMCDIRVDRDPPCDPGPTGPDVAFTCGRGV